MGKIQIMTDSASDISYADEQRYSISVIPFPITLGDKSYTTCLEALRRLMVEKLGYEPEASYQTGAAVAANSGPRVVGVSFTRKTDA